MMTTDSNGRQIKTIALSTHYTVLSIVIGVFMAVLSLVGGKAWGRAEILDKIVTQGEYQRHLNDFGRHADHQDQRLDNLERRLR